MHPPIHSRRSGFTLIELLVVISIIAILAGMLLPAIGLVRENARKQESAKKMNQIFTAALAYSGDYDTFPFANGGVTMPVTSGSDAATVTAQTFELMSKILDLPPALFRCPTAQKDKFGNPRDDKSTFWTTTSSDWTNDKMSYAYDWAAPGDAATKSTRVWITDRSPEYWGGKGVMACYGDGHTGFLKTTDQTGAGTNKTHESDYAGNGGKIVNPDTKDKNGEDFIFDDEKDPGNMSKRGGGSATRAWVK